MILDLRKGFGDFPEYKLFKFPDESIKLVVKTDDPISHVITSLRTHDDIWTLALVTDILSVDDHDGEPFTLFIDYLMYQQDDRRFNENESFGLKILANFINSLKYDEVVLFHPHSDVAPALINNCYVQDNISFIDFTLNDFILNDLDKPVWVIPDSGAFKSQFKQIEKLNYPDFIVCNKSRDHSTGEITTIVNTEDLQGKDCFIVDDICLGGSTFINIAKELKKKNCGKLYLVVSHGVFNKGIIHLLDYFDTIYTTNSICTLEEKEDLKIYKLP